MYHTKRSGTSTSVQLALPNLKRAAFSGPSSACIPHSHLQVAMVTRIRQEIYVRLDDYYNTHKQKMPALEQNFPDREMAIF